MTIRNGTIGKDKLFYLFYVIYLVQSILSESRYIEISLINSVLILLRYVSLLGLAFMAVCKQKHIGVNKFVSIVVVLLSTAMTIFFFEGGISLLFIVFIAMASQNISLEEFFKITVLCIIISNLFVIISSRIGIIPDVVSVRWIGNNALLRGEYIRHARGFLVSNQVPTTFAMVYLLILTWKKGRLSFFGNIVVILLNNYFFSVFGSRLVYLIVFLVLILCFVVRILNKFEKSTVVGIYKIFSYSFAFCAIMSVMLSYLYTSSSRVLFAIDELFNHRLSMAYDALKYYGISLFGHGKLAGTYYGALSSITVDNGYVSFLLQNGVILGVVTLILWTYIAKKSIKFDNKYVFWSIVVISIMNFINADIVSYRVAIWYCILFNQNDCFLTEEQGNTVLKRMKRIRIKSHW